MRSATTCPISSTCLARASQERKPSKWIWDSTRRSCRRGTFISCRRSFPTDVKGVTVITHPLVQHNLTRLRDKRTAPQEFRRVLSEVAALMLYEATRSFAVKPVPVQTPLASARGFQLQHEVVLIPILRAGLGMLDSLLQLLPHARVGFIGLKREETTLRAIFYHKSLPHNLSSFEVILIDPMLATGGSVVAALDLLADLNARRVRLVSLVA